MGRPPKYKTVQEFEKKIEEYIEECSEKKIPLTITGLCLFCGFESRQSFYAYGKKPEFSYTIKRAHLAIERSYEIRLSGNTVTGAIFALKNLGWSDHTSVDHTSGGQKIQPINISVTKDENVEKYKQHIDKLAQLN